MKTSDPVVITCALTGGMTVPTQSKAIPLTVSDIVRQGVEAVAAGASVLHVHVRDEATGRPVADQELFHKVFIALSAETDAVLQPTTGGGRGMTVAERGSVLQFSPEMATLNAGSMNFGIYPVAARDLPFEEWEREYLEGTKDYIFKNTFSDITYLAELMKRNGTIPEIEIYDVGQIFNIRRLIDEGAIVPPFNLQFVLGVLGGNQAEPDQLIHMLRTSERTLRDIDFSWSAAGVGYRGEFGVAAMALALGGNIRVGLEDNLRVRKDKEAFSNAELVTKAAAMADYFDRRPATPAEARVLLHLKGADKIDI